MAPLTPQGLRDAWQSFFTSKGHTAYPSASLVPANDPTLLFTGAGMNQFKDMFLGKGSHPFRRASTVQKCLRAGDIDNVGRTLRHFTFFEMLGNFSFDDYFKEEAIAWAAELSFGRLGIPQGRCLVTVYTDDDESAALWKKQGFPPDRILRFGAKDNFWPANAPDDGPNGPCGPCTEMYYDLQPERPLPKQGVAELEGERFLEFWNLVFPQFNRTGVRQLDPLGRRNVDTGAGLERVLAVVEGHGAPFHTAGIRPVLEKAAEIVGVAYDPKGPEAHRLRRIADHARSSVFLAADGVKPSNEGRGYVLRRILRRAIRDGILLKVDEPFLSELVPSVVRAMSDGYPALRGAEKALKDVLHGEEEQFRATYAKGLRYFEEELPRFRAAGVVPGAVAFRLHDTYGFPIDLLTQIAEEEHRLTVDRAGFDRELEAQRERARAASKMAGDVFDTGPLGEIKARGGKPTTFLGYDGEGLEGRARVIGLVAGDRFVESAAAGDEVSVVLDRTPFYAEGGGQVGDRGTIVVEGPAGPATVAVRDAQAREGFTLHVGKVESGTVAVGAAAVARVDRARRDATRRNHTATHLLHEALKRVLGSHVQQKGSLVSPDRLRFDFSHPKAVSPEEVARIEALVNGWVLENADVRTDSMETEAAKASGAVALFGENYGDRVRVVGVPGREEPFVSRELCGGTHVRRAGDIGAFRVTTEGSVASGVRRLEAVTGLGALAAAAEDRERLRELSGILKAPPDQVVARITALQDEIKEVRRQAEKAAAGAAAKLASELAGRAESVGGLRVVVGEARGIGSKALRPLWDELAKGGVDFAFLVGEEGDKAPLLAAGTAKAKAAKVHAGTLLKEAVATLGGNGGGGPDMAQGLGLDRAKIPPALSGVRSSLARVLPGA